LSGKTWVPRRRKKLDTRKAKRILLVISPHYSGYSVGLPYIHHRKKDVTYWSAIKKRTYQRQRGLPSFCQKRGFHVGSKIKSTLVHYRHICSWFTYHALGFPLVATTSETQILAF
jgi:hypothetical protein